MTADTRQQFQGEERKRELHWEATLLCLRKPEKRGDVGSTSMSAAWRAWPPPAPPDSGLLGPGCWGAGWGWGVCRLSLT